jgi:tRNA(Ile)-lysidine synthase
VALTMGGRLDPSVAAVRRATRSECADLAPGAAVIVASSGGADSLVLAAAAVFEGRRGGWLVGAATVDHGLQDGSAAVSERAAAALREIGCDPVHVLAVTVGEAGGPEAAARAARYEALEDLAAETSATVLLGHTLDDQAETVLLGLARGSGPRSLAGMRRRRGPFRRPLLDVPRETVRAAADALGLVAWSDPHNDDPRFARVRVRTSVLPTLERELGPGVAAALSRTARLARADADALDAWAADACASAQDETGGLAVDVLAGLPGAIRTRVLRLAALAAGSPATDLAAGHVDALEALLDGWHGQRGISLPGRVVARRSGAHIRFEQAPDG